MKFIRTPRNPRKQTSAEKKFSVFAIYKAKDGWRWSLTAGNGRKIADSGEAYNRKFECKQAARRVNGITAKIIIQEAE